MKRFGVYNGDVVFVEKDGYITDDFMFRNVCLKKAGNKKSSAGNNSHSHNGRSHNHPLPLQGVAHKHGKGAIGK